MSDFMCRILIAFRHKNKTILNNVGVLPKGILTDLRARDNLCVCVARTLVTVRAICRALLLYGKVLLIWTYAIS